MYQSRTEPVHENTRDLWGPERQTYEDELVAFVYGTSNGAYGQQAAGPVREATVVPFAAPEPLLSAVERAA